MTLYDRACLNDALDALLDRENGKGEEEEAKQEAREERVDREAERAAKLDFGGWRDGEEDAEDE